MKLWTIGAILVIIAFPVMAFAACPGTPADCYVKTGTGPYTYTAIDCSDDAVNASVAAAADSDSVVVPAGECTWDTHVNIADKTITLQGAGTGCDTPLVKSASGHAPASCTGTATNITVTDTTAVHATTSNKSFRITGFRFNRNVADVATIYIDKTSGQLNTKSAVPWRVDNCYFNGSGRHISVNGSRNFGLVDHIIVYATDETVGNQIFLFWGTGEGESAGTADLDHLAGQVAHSDAINLGSADALYVEDSEFFVNKWSGSQNIGDGTAGQRMVIRYNTVRGPMIENHGACTGAARGSYTYEIYENDMYTYDWNGSTGYQFSGIKMRGGTGVIYNNRFYGTWEQAIVFDNQRSVPGEYCLSPMDDLCDGDSALDMNAIGGRATPLCLDQVGAGAGLIGSQAEAPVYVWGNTVNGSARNPVVSATVNNPTHIVLNRDYYNSEKSGYTAYNYPHPQTDLAAPTTTISTVAQTVTASSLSVVGTASDAVGVSSCKWRLASAPTAVAGTACTGTTSWTCAVTGLSSGANTVYVGCTDAAANWGAGDDVVITYNDTTAAPITLGTGATWKWGTGASIKVQ